MTRLCTLGWLAVAGCYSAQNPMLGGGSADDQLPPDDAGVSNGDALIACTPTSFDGAVAMLGPSVDDASDFGYGTEFPADGVLVSVDDLISFDVAAGTNPVKIDAAVSGWQHPRASADGTEVFAVHDDNSLHHFVFRSGVWTDVGNEPLPQFVPEAMAANDHAFARDPAAFTYSEIVRSGAATFQRVGAGAELSVLDGIIISANLTADARGLVYVLDDSNTDPNGNGVYFAFRNLPSDKFPTPLPSGKVGRIYDQVLVGATLSPDCRQLIGVSVDNVIQTLKNPGGA